MEITELLDEYVKTTTEIDSLSEKKEELKTQILDIFKQNGWDKYNDEHFKAALSSRDTYKFIKKSEAIKWLRANGFVDYLKEDIDSSLNKELKSNNKVFTEGLAGTYQVTSSDVLKVEKYGL